MKNLNENIIEEDGLKIEFVGWTDYRNKKYSSFLEEIHNNLVEDKSGILPSLDSKSGKEDYVKKMRRVDQLAGLLISNRLFLKGIKFDGNYHQNGKYGCPLFKVNDLGIF